jgi:hypothetical protein
MKTAIFRPQGYFYHFICKIMGFKLHNNSINKIIGGSKMKKKLIGGTLALLLLFTTIVTPVSAVTRCGANARYGANTCVANTACYQPCNYANCTIKGVHVHNGQTYNGHLMNNKQMGHGAGYMIHH